MMRVSEAFMFGLTLVLPLSFVTVACLGEDAAVLSADASPAPVDGALDMDDAGDGSVAFSPASIPGLVLWLRADRGVETVGNAIVTWRDQSTRHNDLLAPTVDARPTLVANSSGGAPAVEFNGSGQFVSHPSALGIEPGAARTLVIVARAASPTAHIDTFAQGQDRDGDNIHTYETNANMITEPGFLGVIVAGVRLNSGQIAQAANFDVQVVRSRPIAAGDDVPSRVDFHYNGTALPLRVVAGPSTATATPSPTTTWLGRNAVDLFAFSAREAIAYDRALNDEELAALQAELLRRHHL